MAKIKKHDKVLVVAGRDKGKLVLYLKYSLMKTVSSWKVSTLLPDTLNQNKEWTVNAFRKKWASTSPMLHFL